MILLYFFVVFDPVRDPFEKDEKSPKDTPFRPNAIDLLITRKVRGWGRGCMSKSLKNRLEKSFVKVLSLRLICSVLPQREIIANLY